MSFSTKKGKEFDKTMNLVSFLSLLNVIKLDTYRKITMSSWKKYF